MVSLDADQLPLRGSFEKDSATSVWRDLAKTRHFGNILKAFGYFINLHLAFGIIFKLLWQTFYAIGQILIRVAAKFGQ